MQFADKDGLGFSFIMHGDFSKNVASHPDIRATQKAIDSQWHAVFTAATIGLLTVEAVAFYAAKAAKGEAVDSVESDGTEPHASDCPSRHCGECLCGVADRAYAAEVEEKQSYRARLLELLTSRDNFVLGHPDGRETPNPIGWERENPEDAVELSRLQAVHHDTLLKHKVQAADANEDEGDVAIANPEDALDDQDDDFGDCGTDEPTAIATLPQRDMKSANRGYSVRTALLTFCEDTGQVPNEDGWADIIGDFVCDLAHFCDDNNIRIQDRFDAAAAHYNEETDRKGTQFVPVTLEPIPTAWPGKDRLIAIAAELATALSAARAYIGPTERPAPNELYKQIDEAIARAIKQ
jgi:hypothetical protein